MSPEDERRLARDRRTLLAPELTIENHKPSRGQARMRFEAPANVAVTEQDLPGMGIPEGVTRVISARGLDPVPTLARPGHVYVGREIEARGRHWPRSPLANPFKIDERTVDRGTSFLASHICVDAYASYLFHLAHMRGRKADVLALKGQALICWCGAWDPSMPVIPCHAAVLAMLAEGLLDFRDLASRDAMAEKFWGYRVTT